MIASSSAVVRITRSQTARSKNRSVLLAVRKRSSRKDDEDEEIQQTLDVSYVSATNFTKTAIVTPPPKKKAKKKATSSQTTLSASSIKTLFSTIPTSPPDDFASIYSLVTELRQDRTAPCDSMGAEALALAYQNNSNSSTKEEQDKTYRLIVLISLMLSSQTKDAVVASAIQQLHQQNFLSLSKLADVQYTEPIHHCIRSVGFHNNKIKYLQQTAQILQTQFDHDIPKTAQEMIQHLPGVGPKMAYLCEALAWPNQAPTGIGVDTHMHRLFQQIQWVKNAKTPEQTRLQLQLWLPHEYWRDINLLWVGFGQEVQQQAPKVLYKAVYQCSRPKEALRLLQRCGMNVKQVALLQQQQVKEDSSSDSNELLERVQQLLSK